MNSTERLEWLEQRRNGIGSSDAPAILGLSKWKGPLDVYLAKVTPARSDVLTGPQEWGHRLEPAMAAAIMDRTGWKLSAVPTKHHREFDFLLASIDRENEHGEIIELKNRYRDDGFGEPETDEVPQDIWIQVQHQLEVCDRDVAWVYVLVGGNDFRRYRVARDADYLPTVIEPLTDFWQCVESRTPPEIDFGAENIVSALNRLYTPKPGTVVALDGGAGLVADEYESLGEQVKELESRREECKARLIGAVGDHELGVLVDGRRVQRKLVDRKGYTVEPKSLFDFRILKAKGAK